MFETTNQIGYHDHIGIILVRYSHEYSHDHPITRLTDSSHNSPRCPPLPAVPAVPCRGPNHNTRNSHLGDRAAMAATGLSSTPG